MNIKRIIISVMFFAMCTAVAFADKPNAEWTKKIRSIAPEEAVVKPEGKHKALLFSLMTGYQHSVTPYTSEVVKLLGEKTGAYETVVSNDPKMFEPDKIEQFDIIFLNNNCSKGGRRNLLFDATGEEELAKRLEDSLIDHVKQGNGLVVLHGSIVMQNNSPEFSKMVGGSFDFHPPNQTVVCKLVDPGHPLVAPFEGKDFVHKDEPYLFKNAYTNFNFHPLLKMKLEGMRLGKHAERVKSLPRYVAWIKPYGKGRVFYCSPSHNPQSYEQPELLEFILGGIQYAAGDLDCDDRPIGKTRAMQTHSSGRGKAL